MKYKGIEFHLKPYEEYGMYGYNIVFQKDFQELLPGIYSTSAETKSLAKSDALREAHRYIDLYGDRFNRGQYHHTQTVSEEFKIKRVSYGKASTPVKLREYKIVGVPSSPVGSVKEWYSWAQEKGFKKMVVIESDGSQKTITIKPNWNKILFE